MLERSYPTNDQGQRVCGAKLQGRPGEVCGVTSIDKDNGRCNKHGGGSLRGVSSPSFRTGLRSKYASGRLATRLSESLQDSELISIRDDVALADTRIKDMLEILSEGGLGPAEWAQLRGQVRRLRQALEMPDDDQRKPSRDEIMAILKDIEDIATRGVEEGRAWSSVLDLAERHAKLAEAERRRMIDAGQMLSLEKLLAIQAAFVEIIRSEIGDQPQVLANISRRMAQITDGSGRL